MGQRRYRLPRWVVIIYIKCLASVLVGQTAKVTMAEVDEVVDRKDPTGGRRVNGEIGEKLEVKGKSEEELLQSAV